MSTGPSIASAATVRGPALARRTVALAAGLAAALALVAASGCAATPRLHRGDVVPPAAVILKAPIAQSYRDIDPVARVPRDPRARDLGFLNAYLAQQPDEPVALVQRAWVHAVLGDAERARADLKRALSMRRIDDEIKRHVRWSGGWVRFNLGDYPGALALWEDAIRRHGGRPFWAPYTLAIGHWRNGNRAEALRWYERAARDFPERWTTPQSVALATRHWSSAEREAINAIFRAFVDEQRLRQTQVPT